MGLLDDILNATPNGQGMGLTSYLPANLPAPDPSKKAATADELAIALGLNNIGDNQDAAAPAPAAAPGVMSASAPGAPQVPISQSNFAPPPAPAPMTSPVSAPQFGANPSPYLFPQSATFGANAPAPAPIAPAVANANAAASDDDDEAPATPANASPIAIGNYQMPRIGPASAFTPQSAPAVAPAPAAPVAAPSPLDAAGNAIGDRLKASWQSMRHGGGLIGGASALVTGQRDDPQADALAVQSQTANLTAQALLKAGIAPEVVHAAVQPGNGEMLKALLPALSPQAYTQETDKDGNVWNVNKQTGQKTVALQQKDEKFQNVNTKNPDGSETHQAFNTKTGEYVGAPAAASARASIDPNLTGKDRLDAIMAADPNYGRKIQAMVNGDVPLPNMGQASRSPQAQKMIEDALAVDGSTSASDFATRAATRKDYASGVASRVTKSLNTTIEHAQRLDDAIDKLGNHTYFPGVTNWVHDKIGGNTNPEYQKARSDFESAKEAFVKELDFTLSGGHSSVSGSAELRNNINRADSPEALHAAIQTDLHLLSARLDSHTTGFNQGTKSQRDPQDFLYPKNRAAFNKLMGSADTSTGVDVAPPPTAATAPATATPALKIGQSATINGVSIKKVAD